MDNAQDCAIAADDHEEVAFFSQGGLVQVRGQTRKRRGVFMKKEWQRVAIQFGDHLPHDNGGVVFFSMGDEADHARRGCGFLSMEGSGIS